MIRHQRAIQNSRRLRRDRTTAPKQSCCASIKRHECCWDRVMSIGACRRVAFGGQPRSASKTLCLPMGPSMGVRSWRFFVRLISAEWTLVWWLLAHIHCNTRETYILENDESAKFFRKARLGSKIYQKSNCCNLPGRQHRPGKPSERRLWRAERSKRCLLRLQQSRKATRRIFWESWRG